MDQPTFGDVFRDRIDQIEKDAHEAGINLTVVCKRSGVSRATPDRWRRKLPKTIEIIDSMEKVVEDHKAGQNAETPEKP